MGTFMRNFCATLIACSIISTAAFAADADGALAPGRPAGVKQAQMADHTTLLLIGAGVVAAAVIIAASSGGGNHNSVSSTTTSTTP
jgi:hypothetical protein